MKNLFQFDNAGSELHYTAPRRLLSDKDVLYLCVIAVLIAIHYVR